MNTDNFNLNLTEGSLQVSRNFGSTTFYNVNSNTSVTVPWGGLDWVSALTSWTITVAVNVGLLYLAGHFFKIW